MIETQLNVFDASVIGIMVLSCLFAFFRGFVREILSLGAWIGAGIVTIYYFPHIAMKLEPHFKSPTVAAGVGTLGIYLLALIGFSLFNMVIIKFFKEGSDVGMLDNTLGLIFGAFRGALIISLGFFLITIVMQEEEYPDWIKEAQTRTYVERGAVLLASVAPEYLREISSLEKKALEERKERGGDESVYSTESSRHLKQMIESSEHSE